MGNAAAKRKSNVPRHSKRSAPKPPPSTDVSFGRECLTLVLGVSGLFIALSLYSHYFDAPEFGNMMGRVGGEISHFLADYLGWCSAALPLWAFLLAARVWNGEAFSSDGKTVSTLSAVVGSLLMMSAASAFVAVFAG
ncbi:MAG: DNA translocase FtsK 4TM domain-containing protein, partial [Bdellovibrionales bacterium]|nr:DNA translocase FtsK 4TM domain-containing protein [Bdellovibrionales bacterium]